MVKHEPFVIPAGVKFIQTDEGTSIEHAGDVIMHVPVGERMSRISSQHGSVTLRGRFAVDTIEAPEGTVRLEGPVTADRVTAEVVEIVARRFEGKVVRAAKQVVLGPTRINCDVIMAPRIDIDSKASGKVPVIESHNEPGPNAIKGGFSVAEYGELVGDVGAFLESKGLEALEPGEPGSEEDEEEDEEPSSIVIEAHGADGGHDEEDFPDDEESVEDPDTIPEPVRLRLGVHVPPTPVDDEAASDGEPGVEDDPEPMAEAVEVEAEPDPPSEAHAPVDDEDPDLPEDFESLDVVDIEVIDMEPMPDPDLDGWPAQEEPREPMVEHLSLPPAARGEDPSSADALVAAVDETFEDTWETDDEAPVEEQLKEIVSELFALYKREIPPALEDLRRLVEATPLDEIPRHLTDIWNDLVAHHRETGAPIRPKVTNTFNNIMSIIKDSPVVKLNR